MQFIFHVITLVIISNLTFKLHKTYYIYHKHKTVTVNPQLYAWLFVCCCCFFVFFVDIYPLPISKNECIKLVYKWLRTKQSYVQFLARRLSSILDSSDPENRSNERNIMHVGVKVPESRIWSPRVTGYEWERRG